MNKFFLAALRASALLLGGLLFSGQLHAATCSFMGKDKLLIGGMVSPAATRAAPFDVRYRYLAGDVRKEGVCQSTCSAECSGWWGCWQDWKQPPGQYIKSFIKEAQGATWTEGAYPQIPAVTYYIWYHTMRPTTWCADSSVAIKDRKCEGKKEVAALDDEKLIKRYLDDWRLLLQTIDKAEVLLHIEPDLWGYVKQVNGDPSKVPAKVKKGNATDCKNFDDNAAGLAKCMVSMTRKYAPNAKVGLHASPWTYTAKDDGVNTGKFMLALGGGQADFIVTDPSDRDAGFYETVQKKNLWWTNEGAAAYLGWSKDLSDTMNLPNVMWQIPLGNMSLNNTKNRYKDNRVDYLFANLDAVAKARVVALLFGAGNTEQTNPDTDGGNLISKASAYWRNGGTPLCAASSSSSSSSRPASSSSSSAASTSSSSRSSASSSSSSSRPASSSSASSSSANAGSGVTFYQHTGYAGYAVTLAAGDYTLAQLVARGIRNDDVSSLKVPSGWKVVMYEHDNFAGASLSKTADDSTLVDDRWNDRMSSVKITSSAASPAASSAANVNASYRITSDWGSGYCASLTVTNAGSAEVHPWRALVTIPEVVDGKITEVWNATYRQDADKVAFTATSQIWNAKLAPGKSHSNAGFCANRSGGNVKISYKITKDWTNGYCASLTVNNDGPGDIKPWRGVTAIEGTLTEVWNATAQKAGDKMVFTATSEAWNAPVAAGASHSHAGFCANR